MNASNNDYRVTTTENTQIWAMFCEHGATGGTSLPSWGELWGRNARWVTRGYIREVYRNLALDL